MMVRPAAHAAPGNRRNGKQIRMRAFFPHTLMIIVDLNPRSTTKNDCRRVPLEPADPENVPFS